MEKENNFMAELLKFQDDENEKFKVNSIERIKNIYSQIMKLKTDREELEDNFRNNLFVFFNKCRHRFEVVSYGVFSVTAYHIWTDSNHRSDEEQHEFRLYESCKHIMLNIHEANMLLDHCKRIIASLNNRHIYVDEKVFEEQIEIDNLEQFVPSKFNHVFDVCVYEDSGKVNCNILGNSTQSQYDITLCITKSHDEN